MKQSGVASEPLYANYLKIYRYQGSKDMRIRRFAATGVVISVLILPVSSMGITPVTPASPHEFSANLALTTNYMFRGMSQTDNGPAVQGGTDYKYKPYSLYAGVWASNVDSSPDGYDGSSMELDLYVGWAPSWQNLGLDLGYLRYRYPGTDTSENNTDEFRLGISYDVQGSFTPSYTVYYTDDFFGGGPAWYHDVSIEIPLSHGFTLAGHYGWNRFDDSAGDYEDYKVGISTEYLGLGFDLSWVHRSDEAVCSAPFECDSTVVFTLSKFF